LFFNTEPTENAESKHPILRTFLSVSSASSVLNLFSAVDMNFFNCAAVEGIPHDVLAGRRLRVQAYPDFDPSAEVRFVHPSGDANMSLTHCYRVISTAEFRLK
jgi:hypothetical protein